MKKNVFLILGLLLVITVVYIAPEISFAQSFGGGAGFESKINNLTNKLLKFMLPAISIIGLIYASILAATGDENAKKRMVLVVIASIVGFLAPLIIGWMQSAVGV